MDRKYESRTKAFVRKPSLKVDIPFSESEAARFRTFVDSTGRGQGPWVRLIILAAIAREEHLATLRPELTPQGFAAVAPVVDPANKGETA